MKSNEIKWIEKRPLDEIRDVSFALNRVCDKFVGNKN